MIGPFRPQPHAGTIAQPEPPFLPLFLSGFQFFTLSDVLHVGATASCVCRAFTTCAAL